MIVRKLLLLLWISASVNVLAQGTAATRQAAETPAITSPRLQTLHQGYPRLPEESAQKLVNDFWAEMVAQGGTPLVEPKQGDANRFLVTFLWQAPSASANALAGQQEVRLLAPVRRHNTAALQELGETGIWFHTIELPAGVKMSYQLATGPRLSGDRSELRQWMRQHARPDPLNPHQWPEPAISQGGEGARYSVLAMPGAAPADKGMPQGRQPTGEVRQYTLRSRILGNERNIAIYVPARQHLERSARPMSLLVIFDGEEYQHRASVPATLDRLIAAGRLAPTAAVLVGNVDRSRELAPNTAFARFMAEELMPWLHQQQAGISRDPAQVVIAGSSLGGLAASWVAWQHPELFGNVLSMSGSYWWEPADPASDAPCCSAQQPDGWLTRQFGIVPRKKIRFYIDAGLLEHGFDGSIGLLENSQRLRDVLTQRGYAVTYHESPGGHDYLIWQDALARALPQLLDQ